MANALYRVHQKLPFDSTDPDVTDRAELRLGEAKLWADPELSASVPPVGRCVWSGLSEVELGLVAQGTPRKPRKPYPRAVI